MVGLSVLLEVQKSPQVINKFTMIKPFPSSSSSSSSSSCCCYCPSPLPAAAISFLDECFLCKQRLFPGSDIYMYNGDRAFCSMECRYRQIVMDEEDKIKSRENTYCVARPPNSSSRRSKRNQAQIV